MCSKKCNEACNPTKFGNLSFHSYYMHLKECVFINIFEGSVGIFFEKGVYSLGHLYQDFFGIPLNFDPFSKT